jgi:molybdenum cofactor sulfurtransferase
MFRLTRQIEFCWLTATLQAIHNHVSALQAWTYAQLSSLRHSSSQPLLEIFGQHDIPSRQSCLFQFLVHAANGSVVPAEEVEVVAAGAGVHLRTGCHCNPGQCLKDLGIEPQEVSCGLKLILL